MAELRSVDTSLREAVRTTLASVPEDPRDTALRCLITRYAAEIDKDEALKDLGPRLLTALEALQATPRARRGHDRGDTGPSRLEGFRDAG